MTHNIITSDAILSNILFAHPPLIDILSNVGLRMGIGQMTIAEVCQTFNIEESLMLSIINVVIDENYFPHLPFSQRSAKPLMDLFNKEWQEYERFLLPEIESFYNLLAEQTDSENNNCVQLRTQFVSFKKEMITSTLKINKAIITQLKEDLKIIGKGENLFYLKPIDIQSNTLLLRLNDLKEDFIYHFKGDIEYNIPTKIAQLLCHFQKDFSIMIRIYYNVYIPYTKSINLKAHQK